MKPVRDRALMESQTRSRPDHLLCSGGRAAVSLTLFSLSVSHTSALFFVTPAGGFRCSLSDAAFLVWRRDVRGGTNSIATAGRVSVQWRKRKQLIKIVCSGAVCESEA